MTADDVLASLTPYDVSASLLGREVLATHGGGAGSPRAGVGMTATAVLTVTGVHPYAEKFPMLPEGDLAELAESIRANGLRQPVVITTAGLILDGRNRAAACERIGLTPDLVVYGGKDLAEYVIDANASRRHMTTGARAMATALVLADDGRRQNGRWKRGSVLGNPDVGNSGKAWQNALNLAGVILDHAADLSPAVVSGELDLNTAFRQAEDRRDAERRQLEEEERIAAEEADARDFILETAPDLAEQVVDGPLQSYAEAKAVWEKRNREEAERLRREKAEVERKAAEHRRAMTDIYSGMARGLQIVGGYGKYDDITELMAEFGPQHLDPPQYAREFSVENLRNGIAFLTRLIEWQERRDA